MRFFVCDDHALFSGGFALLLKQLYPQAQCHVANSFSDLCEQLASAGQVDLVFLDWHMPDMRGITSIQKLQQSFAGMAVCVVSADDNQAQIRAILNTGVSGFVPKAISSTSLQKAVNLMLEGEVYMPDFAHDKQQATMLTGMAAKLTVRQLEVLKLMANGQSNKQMSDTLGIAESTLKTHIQAIFEYLQVKNRTEAAHKAHQLGIA